MPLDRSKTAEYVRKWVEESKRNRNHRMIQESVEEAIKYKMTDKEILDEVNKAIRRSKYKSKIYATSGK